MYTHTLTDTHQTHIKNIWHNVKEKTPTKFATLLLTTTYIFSGSLAAAL